jgi:tetratricopeptide (TPR) repeat protein
MLHLFRGEPELALRCADAALDIAEEHEFQIWNAVSSCLRGAALAGLGQAEEGLKLLQQATGNYQELKSPPVFWPMLLMLQAGASAMAGKLEEALDLTNEAMDIVEETSRESMSSDIFLLKGDLLLGLSESNAPEAASIYQRALDISTDVGAPMMELRATTRICRLWQAQGKAEPAQSMLSDILEQFTEGFSTFDLIEAKMLLEELEKA